MPISSKVRIYKGLDHDLVIEWSGNFNSYDEVRFSGVGLSLAKTTADAADAERSADGAQLTVHLVSADLASFTPPLEHEWQLHGRTGAKWMPLTDPAPLLLDASS